MNYYPFHLGDYAAHTAHLEPLEDLAYRRMLDAYYLREGPLPPDPTEVSRLIRLRDHAATVRDVLNEFFTATEDGWRHARCDEEIDRMQDKQAKARASAAASVNARRTNAQRTLNDRSTDVELPTPTPTPTPTPVEKKKRSASAAPIAQPENITDQVWTDFLTIRKAKGSPLTATALAGIEREAVKADITLQAALETCCARGWQGFKAEWIQREGMSASATPRIAQPRPMESFRERDERQARKTYEAITGKPHPDNVREAGQVIDVTPGVPFLEHGQ